MGKAGPKTRTLEQIISKAKIVWNNKYNYDSVKIVGNYLENIYCSKHDNYFRQIIGNHLYGKYSCKQCASESRTKFQTLDKQTFLKRLAQRGFNLDLYDFSKFDYISAETKSPHNMQQSVYNCPNCARKESIENQIIPLDKCISKIKQFKHALNYDFSLCDNIKYYGQQQKIPVICNNRYLDGEKHGIFYMYVYKLLTGACCPKCNDNHKMTTGEFVEKCKQRIDFDNYLFDRTVYKNKQTKVTITCKKHGDFIVNPGNFLTGNTCCPECSKENNRKSTEQFIKEAQEIHGVDKFDYSKTNYISSQEYVKIICKKHGEFYQLAQNHLLGHNGCKYCNTNWVSEKEKEIKQYVHKLFQYKTINNYRKTFGTERHELDIYIPELKLGIEYNGIYWHSNHHKSKDYHYHKKQLFESLGIRVIMIWENQTEESWKEEIKNYIKQVSSKEIIEKPGLYNYDKISKLDLNQNMNIKHIFPEPLYFIGTKEINQSEYDENKASNNIIYNCGWLELS